MSTNVTSLTGYDAQDYEALAAQYIARTGQTEAQFEEYISSIITEGMTFDQLEAQVKEDLPRLSLPIYEQDFSVYIGTPPASFGSTYLALIQELAAEQRKQNADAKALQTEEQIANIEEQAKNIRTKAALDLTASLVSGTAQIVSGAVTIGMSASAVKSGATGDALQSKNIQTQGVGTAISGIGTVLSSPLSFSGTMMEAANKQLEADAERMRATQEQLSRIDDALRELLQKARSTQDAIQQNINQTRAKILG